MATKALDQKADSNDFPCVRAPFSAWWGATIGNWRDCLEALTSGDFLSADFFGFAFNDMLSLPLFGLVRDRAAVLEDTWNARYQDVVKLADPSPAKCKGLNCPLLSLKPRSGHWIPLLVLNGTSEATGDRIVTTSLEATYQLNAEQPCPTIRGERGCTLFVEADRIQDLLTSGGSTKKPDSSFDGVLLSTAAHNSARFPLISPPGSIRNTDGVIVDRIVDGGYFENSGALGAKELALGIRAIDPSLLPFVLVISNDPDDAGRRHPTPDAQGPDQEGARGCRPRRAGDGNPDAGDSHYKYAFGPRRPGHGRTSHCAQRCDAEVRPARGKGPRVAAAPRKVGRISRGVDELVAFAPVQRHLHQQTEGTTNENQNGGRLTTVWNAMKMTSSWGKS
jgi:hypothetical protein